MTETTSSGRRGEPGPQQVEARPEPVEFGGVRYQDPFRWLEEDSDAAVMEWQGAQDERAQAYLESLPAFRTFAERMAAIGATDDVSLPTFAGGRWFRTFVPEDQDLTVVEVSDTPTGPGRRVVDMNAMRTGEGLALQTYNPSPDGLKAIFGWTVGGRETPTVQVVEVDTGKVLVDGLPHERPMNFAWLPDGGGFLYMAMDPVTTRSRLFRLMLDNPAGPVAEDVDLWHPVARPMVCADRRHILLYLDHLAPRPDYVMDLEGDGAWRPFLKDVPGIFRGDILGDRFIAITDHGAPRGRLVSIPLATPSEPETWSQIVPGSDNVLASVIVSGGRVMLLDLVDTYARLRVYDGEGRPEGEVALPDRGLVNSFGSYYCMFNLIEPMKRGEDGQVLFVFSAFGQAPALCSVDVASRKLTQLTEPRRRIDVQVLDLAADSADGARVPYHVVARRDLDLSRPQPTVITGYGGFNIAVLPGWLGAMWAAWIEAGGVLVLSHLRGGGELGPQWWEQGRLKLKQNSFNDVYATAEDLVARGLTTPAQLGVIGGSNGGVMAAACAVQRPELFRASVPQVPISDLLGRLRDPITMVSTLDYGDPTDPEMAQVLYAWSPYQNVRDAIAYPAVLIDCGANDPRCPPWHGRKLAARLRGANAGNRPILLRVRAGAGHGAVGKASRDLQSAEVLAFLADQLGLEP